MPPDPPDADAALVLAFLAEAGDAYVSGEAIADKLGLPPAAVWREIEALRAHGYVVDAAPARGYRLAAVPDRLTALELGPLLNTHDLGRTVHAYEALPSTNDRAKELAEEGALHGEVVVAEQQTAGRGRRGRAWASPPGVNLYLSVVLRPELAPPRAPELTLVAAVAACDALREAGVEAGIKWPNDLIASGRKIAGILTEVAVDGGRVHWVVVGMGVNLNVAAADLPEEVRATATSARAERGQPVPRALFAAALLTRLEEWVDRHAEEGFAPIREAWRARSVTLGRQVRVRADGRTLEGVAEDIDEAGALLVRTADGAIHRILAGDVEALRPR